MTLSPLLDHPLISQRYFFPRADTPPEPFWIDCAGAKLACVDHRVDPAWPTIVHFHGNGEVVSDYLDGFPQLLERMDCNCFLAEFRGYGGSSGTPELGKMLNDVACTIAALDIQAEKLVLFGRSVGSLFAVKAAELLPNVAGLILESAIADPLERLLLRIRPEEIGTTEDGLANAIKQAIDIEGILKNFSRPALLMHTKHDGLIDMSHAEKLAGWCAGETTLKIFPQGSHNDIMFVNGREYFEEIRRFLARLRA